MKELTSKQESARNYYLRNKQATIDGAGQRYRDLLVVYRAWRETLSCCQCNEKETVCLEFHHSDPLLKEQNVIRMVARGPKSVVKELKKCVVVCANCHRKIHAYGIQTFPVDSLWQGFEKFYDDVVSKQQQGKRSRQE